MLKRRGSNIFFFKLISVLFYIRDSEYILQVLTKILDCFEMNCSLERLVFLQTLEKDYLNNWIIHIAKPLKWDSFLSLSTCPGAVVF